MNEKIQSVLNSLPHKPGIYLMKDAQGNILYVGKAISLYNRVRSYFQESSDLSPKNRIMVAKVDDIEFLVVKNEVEALVLESNYIKQYRRKYNVLLRDDKNYPYIKVSLAEDFPRVYRVRSFQRDGNRYFGPYTNSGAVDSTLDLLNKLFAFRTCRYDASNWAPPINAEPPAGWKQRLLARPCTQFYIHRCIAPCVGYATREEYDAVIQQVVLFLQGTRDSSLGEVMSSFLQQFYESSPHIPAEVIVEVEPDDRAIIQNWLKEKRGGVVTLIVPKRGEKLRLVEMVKQNALEVLEQQRIKWLTDSQKTQMALEELQDVLNLAAPPMRIECYDISNTQGTNSVGAMVVFEAGRPRPNEYRRFKIKTVAGPNDFASIQEMLRRRFRRQAQQNEERAEEIEQEVPLEHDWAMPDLIIIDGGKGQLSAAMEVLQELHIDVPTTGLAKENEELFIPGSPDPIILPRTSQGLYMVQRIRDEAHRFGITYHRKLRSDRTFKSVLDEIPGIGPKRKQALMKRFGSVRAISAASLEELAGLDGMTKDSAEKVKEYIGRME